MLSPSLVINSQALIRLSFFFPWHKVYEGCSTLNGGLLLNGVSFSREMSLLRNCLWVFPWSTFVTFSSVCPYSAPRAIFAIAGGKERCELLFRLKIINHSWLDYFVQNCNSIAQTMSVFFIERTRICHIFYVVVW